MTEALAVVLSRENRPRLTTLDTEDITVLQRIVGGPLEQVRLQGRSVLLVNEEGRMTGDPTWVERINWPASFLASAMPARQVGPPLIVCGDAVVFSLHPNGSEWTSVEGWVVGLMHPSDA